MMPFACSPEARKRKKNAAPPVNAVESTKLTLRMDNSRCISTNATVTADVHASRKETSTNTANDSITTANK